MFLTHSSWLKRAVAAAAVLAATVGSATAANDYPTVSAAEDAGELVGPPAAGDPELADLVQRLLEELGMAPDVARYLVSDLIGDVTDRINAMVDEGLVTIEQVDALREHVENGTFDEQIPGVGDATRARRDAFHQAAREVLRELGIDVPDRVSIHEVLRDNEMSRADLDDFLAERGIDLPRPPRGPGSLPGASPRHRSRARGAAASTPAAGRSRTGSGRVSGTHAATAGLPDSSRTSSGRVSGTHAATVDLPHAATVDLPHDAGVWC
jgi:hypothetical protein